MANTLQDILDTTFDSRDLFERVQEIEDEFVDDDGNVKITDPEIEIEYVQIKDILDEIGDEAVYGVALIREDFFEDYAREFAEDIGAIDTDAPWPASYIDWEAAADALKGDYTVIEIDGDTFYYR